jgi:Holliday junction resolvase RusA-like endonuclease
MPWRKQATATMIEQALKQGWKTPTTEGIKLTVLFIFERPKTVKRAAMTVKPDIDHLIRAVGDAGTQANLYPDDSQITEIISRKIYGKHPRTLVVFSYERKCVSSDT